MYIIRGLLALGGDNVVYCREGSLKQMERLYNELTKYLYNSLIDNAQLHNTLIIQTPQSTYKTSPYCSIHTKLCPNLLPTHTIPLALKQEPKTQSIKNTSHSLPPFE